MRLYSLSPYGSECIFTEYLRYDLRAQDKYLLKYQLRRYSDPLECVFIYDLHVNVDLFFVLNMGKNNNNGSSLQCLIGDSNIPISFKKIIEYNEMFDNQLSIGMQPASCECDPHNWVPTCFALMVAVVLP